MAEAFLLEWLHGNSKKFASLTEAKNDCGQFLSVLERKKGRIGEAAKKAQQILTTDTYDALLLSAVHSKNTTLPLLAPKSHTALLPPKADGMSTSVSPHYKPTTLLPPEADGMSTSVSLYYKPTALIPPEANDMSTSVSPHYKPTALIPPEADDRNTSVSPHYKPTTLIPPEADGMSTSVSPHYKPTALIPPKTDGMSTSVSPHYKPTALIPPKANDRNTSVSPHYKPTALIPAEADGMGTSVSPHYKPTTLLPPEDDDRNTSTSPHYTQSSSPSSSSLHTPSPKLFTGHKMDRRSICRPKSTQHADNAKFLKSQNSSSKIAKLPKEFKFRRFKQGERNLAEVFSEGFGMMAEGLNVVGGELKEFRKVFERFADSHEEDRQEKKKKDKKMRTMGAKISKLSGSILEGGVRTVAMRHLFGGK